MSDSHCGECGDGLLPIRDGAAAWICAACRDRLNDETYDDGERDGGCTMCGGDGYDECDDEIQCTRRHRGGLCPCAACNGSGLASKQTIW